MDDAEWLDFSLENLMGESREDKSGFTGFLLLPSVTDISEKKQDCHWGTDVLEMLDIITEPIPFDEFSEADKKRYGELIKQHKAQLMISVWPNLGDVWETGYRYLKRMEEEIHRCHASAVYTAGRIISAEAFLAENNRPIPMHNWVSVFFKQSAGGLDAYTMGLEDFGGKELEIHDSGKNENEIRALLEYLVMEMLQKRQYCTAEEVCYDKEGNRYHMRSIQSRYFDGHPLLLQPE